MITLKELNPKNFPTTPEIDQNLNKLLEHINKFRGVYGKPMNVTSGLRSMEDHLRIYKQKGITDPAKIPMASKHLQGKAVDIADPKGELMDYCKANEALLQSCELWLEDNTKGWVHFQCEPPKSGKRFFKP